MRPRFNSLPRPRSNQNQGNGAIAAGPQQVMPSNQFQGNQSNLFPSSMQFHPQMGVVNPQTGIPLGNSNTSSTSTITAPSLCVMNVPNEISPLQNRMPLLGSQHMNSIGMGPMNSSQPFGQFFACSPMNPPQFFSQNVGLPNCFPNPMHNMNQFMQMQMQMQMSNGGQFFSNIPICPNQVSLGTSSQNPPFSANSQFGFVNGHGVVQPGVDVNALKQLPNTAQCQPVHGNSSSPLAFSSTETLQNQHYCQPGSEKSLRNQLKDTGFNKQNAMGKNSPNRNFSRNSKRDASRGGFVKSQFHHARNANGMFSSHNEHGEKGYNNNGNSGYENSTNQTPPGKKSSLSLNYTEQEILQWRAARKTNYPSKANSVRKAKEKLTESDITNKDAILRRQQLKEILAKQAELGVEVAEIPSHYLADSKQQVQGGDENRTALSKKGRFRNKYNKRGRFSRNDRFAKKQRLADCDSSKMNGQSKQSTEKQVLKNKQLTLLQKLLSSDIERDKSHLLQVFRFMAMNSFFKDWPEKPLRFPLTIVRAEGEVVEERSLDEKGVSEGWDKSTEESNGKEVAHFVGGRISNGKVVDAPEEEEGEIID